MVSYQNYSYDSNGITRQLIAGVCLSGDTKPTDVFNGSILFEMDTSKVYMFDQANNEWKEWSP